MSLPKNRRISFNSNKRNGEEVVALWDQVQVLLNPRCPKVDVNHSGKYIM